MKEVVEYWYRAMEDAKNLIPRGAGLGCRYSYADSIYEPFANIALQFEHAFFCWRCENPAPIPT